MPMLYEVLTRQTYYEQQVLNRFHYLSTVDPVSASGSFALAWGLGFINGVTPFVPDVPSLFAALLDIQSDQLVYNEVQISALYDPMDFFAVPYNPAIPGANVSESMSPIAAVGFRSNRVRTDIRRGFKRFSGASEAQFTSGGAVAPGAESNIIEVATQLSATVEYTEDGDSGSFVPVVCQFEMYTSPPAPKAYRKYATFEDQILHTAVSVTYAGYDKMRTQNSRQYGRGA